MEAKHYDLIVVGGGLAGVSAAIAAAREGLRVLLTEQSGMLGGALASGLIYPFMPYWTKTQNDVRLLNGGIFSQMRRRMEDYCPPAHFSDFSTEHFKFMLDDMVQQAGVSLLLHAKLFAVRRNGRRLHALLFATKAGQTVLTADYFIDATGDGDVFAFAGCAYQLGREKDNLCQPMTACFRLANVDEQALSEENEQTLQARYVRLKAEGRISNPREDILKFRGQGLGTGVVHFNTTRVVRLDPTDPFALTQAELLARRQIREMLSFLAESELPPYRHAHIVNAASSIGVRESRKLRGVYVLTAEDLLACRRFEDAIAVGNYDLDIHNPEGSGTSHHYFAPGEYYTIPYRSLLPKETDNLLVAGRCISATHEAQSSIRIMPICACTGEAAGTAIALAYKTCRATSRIDLNTLRQRLRQNGAVID